MKASIEEHVTIMEAILAGDSTAASKAMRAHVALLGEGLSDLIHYLSRSEEEEAAQG